MEREPRASLLYSMKQSAEYLGISRTTLYKLCNEGKLTRVYVFAKPLIRADELARFYASLTSERTPDED
ncbi:MAG: helix-turn-helix domain-containing protein [Coriobacteriia bacterium]|nr:helix-turn-helix domain-containing protein [Coriobacteriia bacterium]